jgi:hypothetical protein
MAIGKAEDRLVTNDEGVGKLIMLDIGKLLGDLEFV